MAHWGLMGETTKSVLFELRDAGIIDGYYLTGGTALALQLGHRVSRDLDLFTKRVATRLAVPVLIRRCEKEFGKENVTVRLHEDDQVWFDINGVNVTFLAFPFGLKYPTVKVSGVEVADIRDIALQKAYAIGRRAKARDYIDLAYILEEGVITLERLVAEAQMVFTINGERVFSPRLFLQQLTYMDDLTDREEALRLLVRQRSFDDIAVFLGNHVQRVAQLMLSGQPGIDAKSQPRKSLREWPHGFVKSSTGVVHLLASPSEPRTLCGRSWPRAEVVRSVGNKKVDFCDVCKKIAGAR